jgi:hypothetical protein
MSKQGLGWRLALLVLLLRLVALTPAFAGTAVVGTLAGSVNATVGGVTVLPNAILFSGDRVEVKDGAAIVVLGKTSRVTLGRDTVASFLRDVKEVTVLLGQGDVSLFRSDDSVALRVKAGDVSVSSEEGVKTWGEITMLNSSWVIRANEGTLLVEHGGQTARVAKGKPLLISSQASQAPQGGAPRPPRIGVGINWAKAFLAASVGASGASATVAALAMKRTGDAKAATDSAAATATSALSAAQSAATATSAAATATSSALNGLTNICAALSPYFPALPACP